jgi:hypothetical protein
LRRSWLLTFSVGDVHFCYLNFVEEAEVMSATDATEGFFIATFSVALSGEAE